MDLVVAGTEDALVMVEAGAHEVSEELMLEALRLAHEEIKKLVAMQQELFQQKRPVKWVVAQPEYPAELVAEIRQSQSAAILEALCALAPGGPEWTR